MYVYSSRCRARYRSALILFPTRQRSLRQKKIEQADFFGMTSVGLLDDEVERPSQATAFRLHHQAHGMTERAVLSCSNNCNPCLCSLTRATPSKKCGIHVWLMVITNNAAKPSGAVVLREIATEQLRIATNTAAMGCHTGIPALSSTTQREEASLLASRCYQQPKK